MYIYTSEIEEPIKPDVGIGVEFDHVVYEDNRGPAVTYLPERDLRDGKRMVTMDFRSWSGLCPGAVHTYVDLKWDGASYRLKSAPEENIYTTPNGMPGYCETTTIQVERPVSRKDIKHFKDTRADDPAFNRPKIGGYTRDFWSEDEARDYVLRHFAEWFAPGWVLMEMNYDTGHLEEVMST